MKQSATTLKRKGTAIRISAKYANAVRGAGWVSVKWWSNGFYDFTYRGTRYYRLCLSHTSRPNIGYNAVVKKIGKGYGGLVWDDTATLGASNQIMAEAVNGK